MRFSPRVAAAGLVLVTGATGFIGGALARTLVRSGRPVRMLVRNESKVSRRLGDSAEVYVGSVTDLDAVRGACNGVDTVFHIAGAFREPGLSDSQYQAVNVTGTRHVIEAAAAGGARRLIYCSTSGIHGSIAGRPAREDHPLDLNEVYERTKAEGETLALEYGRDKGLEVVAIRPAQVYGPGDTRLLKLFKMARARLSLWLGPGTARYHLLYIDDLVQAFLLAETAPEAAGQAFLVAGPEIPTLNQVYAAVARAVGNEKPRLLRLPSQPFYRLGGLCERIFIPLGLNPPIYRRRVEFFTKDKAYDISKARDQLGYAPQVGMREGLGRTFEWYREHGLL